MSRCSVGTLAILGLVLAGCATGPTAPAPREKRSGWCRPGQSCWPRAADWQRLRSRLTGKLEVPRAPLAPCSAGGASDACAAAIAGMKNPLGLQDDAAGTQSTGWLGAWTAAPSAVAVAVETPADVAAAVDFAREHRLRLVIKGTGHDYYGRSSAPDSLLVWTHRMRRITVHDSFVARGCPGAGPGVPAVTAEAGARWIEAYQAVTVEHGRYVQGGGCTSVGVAGGFIQGGGFGSWSKKYGTGAAGMLEAEVVTADGKRLVANACQNQDLFWALRGGGGGTYGVVTSVTLMTHALPSSFGLVVGSITATSDAAFKELLERFLRFYRERLSDEHWGEQVRIEGDNSLRLSMVFQGMSGAEAEQVWQPLRAWIDAHPDRVTMNARFIALPGDRMWDFDYLNEHFPGVVRADPRPDQPARLFWWAGDEAEVSTYWYAYQSRWIPLDRFEGAEAARFAAALFAASRRWPVALHFNKGQAGASADALARDRETSMNPAVYRAAALAIIAAGTVAFPGAPGHAPDLAEGRAHRARVAAAARIIREATPGAGTYVNEADYFQPGWQREFWGENYDRLLAIKRKYDPDGVFHCHHCVGSEHGPGRSGQR